MSSSCGSCAAAGAVSAASGTASIDLDECGIYLSKALMTALLVYLLYIAITCPCKPYLACHLQEYYMGIFAVLLLVMVHNGMRFRSYQKKK